MSTLQQTIFSKINQLFTALAVSGPGLLIDIVLSTGDMPIFKEYNKLAFQPLTKPVFQNMYPEIGCCPSKT